MRRSPLRILAINKGALFRDQLITLTSDGPELITCQDPALHLAKGSVIVADLRQIPDGHHTRSGWSSAWKVVSWSKVDPDAPRSGLEQGQAEPIPWLKLLPAQWTPKPKSLASLLNLVDTLSPRYAALVHACFARDEDARAFLIRSASTQFHHKWDGGLLQHTAEAAQTAAALSDQYPSVDRDVLLTAAILHDVGKVREYSVPKQGNRLAFGFVARTEVGKLLMHKIIGVQMLDDAARRVGFPRGELVFIQHCLVAANGPDYMGLPRVFTREAHMLSVADRASGVGGQP